MADGLTFLLLIPFFITQNPLNVLFPNLKKLIQLKTHLCVFMNLLKIFKLKFIRDSFDSENDLFLY